jgi:hypothetical protein
MSIDRRLRAGLVRSADAIRPDVSAARRAVEQRARRRGRIVTVARFAAAAAVAVVAAIVWTAALHGPPRAGMDVLPAGQPVGAYVVDVPASDLAQRQGMAGRWVVTLRPDGVLHITPPEAFTGNSYGATYQTNGDLLRTNAFISSPGCQLSGDQMGTYRWIRTATELTFTVVADTCDARRLLFGGQAWQVS